MRRNFNPGLCGRWESSIQVVLSGAPPLSLEFVGGRLSVSTRLRGTPLSVIESDNATLFSILRGDSFVDTALMTGALKTSNLNEVFKLISVFYPAREAITAELRRERSLFQDPTLLKDFFTEFASIAESDSQICQAAAEAGISASAVVKFQNPDFALSIRVLKNRVLIKFFSSTCKKCPSLDSAALHGFLSGTRNIMIGLTGKNLDGLAAKGIDPDLVKFLIYTLPAFSRIYRELHRRKGLGL